MKKKLLLSVAALMAATFAFTACSSSGDKMASIKSAGEIVVYTDPNFAPFEFVGNNGEVVGVDIEIIKAIAEELGVKYNIKESPFDAIVMAIKGGKGDIAASGFTITEERLESVDFSHPYFNTTQYLILKGDNETIKAVEDLAGINVGVAKGYTGQLWIDEEMSTDEDGNDGVLKDKGTASKEYDNAIDAVLDLRGGRIEAVIMDEDVSKSLVAKYADELKAIPLQYIGGEVVEENYGIVVAKGNDELLAVINKVVDRLVSEGKIDEWLEQFNE